MMFLLGVWWMQETDYLGVVVFLFVKAGGVEYRTSVLIVPLK